MDERIKRMAARLVELRGEKTLDEVAKALGISVSALCMYENASRVPRDEVKIRIARFYNTGIESIFFNL